MAKFPTVQTATKTGALFNQMRDRGKPDSISLKWLEAAGFKSSNDRQFIAVLRFLGIIDSRGAPTSKFDALKRPDWKKSLAAFIKEAYVDVFKNLPNAHQRSRQELVDEFRSHDSSSGAESINRAVSAFQALCAVADFSAASEGSNRDSNSGSDTSPDPGAGGSERGSGSESGGKGGGGGGPMSVTINLSLELPPTENEDVYDKLFASMAKHLGALVRGGN